MDQCVKVRIMRSSQSLFLQPFMAVSAGQTIECSSVNGLQEGSRGGASLVRGIKPYIQGFIGRESFVCKKLFKYKMLPNLTY